jgi:hypothetical protein
VQLPPFAPVYPRLQRQAPSARQFGIGFFHRIPHKSATFPEGCNRQMSGRPGAKKSSQDKLKDKEYEEQKMRMLERAEKNLAKVSARAARPPHERRLTPARMHRKT